MSYWVYILKCADGSLYTGITTDVERRLREHNGEGARGAKATRAKRPVTLVYREQAATRSNAQKREYALKRLSRSQKISVIESYETSEKTTE